MSIEQLQQQADSNTERLDALKRISELTLNGGSNIQGHIPYHNTLLQEDQKLPLSIFGGNFNTGIDFIPINIYSNGQGDYIKANLRFAINDSDPAIATTKSTVFTCTYSVGYTLYKALYAFRGGVGTYGVGGETIALSDLNYIGREVIVDILDPDDLAEADNIQDSINESSNTFDTSIVNIFRRTIQGEVRVYAYTPENDYQEFIGFGQTPINEEDFIDITGNGNSEVDAIPPYTSPNNYQGSNAFKIQQALNEARALSIPLHIDSNVNSSDGSWIIDEAIKVDSNSQIKVLTKIKISDACRDNVFRSANCGIGITDVNQNQLENISIVFGASGIIEGADNPRATGDHFKTLTLNSTGGNFSYGSDAGDPNEKQTGDWRNIAMLFANCKNLTLENASFKNTHAYAVSLERCKNSYVNGVVFDCPDVRIINGTEQIIRNQDGVDVLFGGDNVHISNVAGITGDDMVAFVNIYQEDLPSGSLDGVTITGNIDIPVGDIHNCSAKNITGDTKANLVRLLSNNQSKIYDVVIRDIYDAKEIFDIEVPVVKIGSFNPLYESTSIDEIYNITVDNVVSRNSGYCVSVEGALKDSNISNLYQAPGSSNDNFYVHPSALGVQNINVTNNIQND